MAKMSGIGCAQFPQEFEAAQRLLVKIGTQHDHIHAVQLHGGDQVAGLCGRTDDLELQITAQCIGQQLSMNPGVVRNQNADRLCSRKLVSTA